VRLRQTYHGATQQQKFTATNAARTSIMPRRANHASRSSRRRGCLRLTWTRVYGEGNAVPPELWTDINPEGHALCDFHSADYVRFKRRERGDLPSWKSLSRTKGKRLRRRSAASTGPSHRRGLLWQYPAFELG